jgi:hypothetical protein
MFAIYIHAPIDPKIKDQLVSNDFKFTYTPDACTLKYSVIPRVQSWLYIHVKRYDFFYSGPKLGVSAKSLDAEYQKKFEELKAYFKAYSDEKNLTLEKNKVVSVFHPNRLGFLNNDEKFIGIFNNVIEHTDFTNKVTANINNISNIDSVTNKPTNLLEESDIDQAIIEALLEMQETKKSNPSGGSSRTKYVCKDGKVRSIYIHNGKTCIRKKDKATGKYKYITVKT